MGVENNEAVLATTWDDKAVRRVREWIDKLPEDQRRLFVLIPALVNRKTTVVLAPDGSKKGWETAAEGVALRNLFIDYLRTFAYAPDQPQDSPWEWVEVGYGEYGQKVLRGNNVNCYSEEEYAESLADD